jgi:hypothetical protein
LFSTRGLYHGTALNTLESRCKSFYFLVCQKAPDRVALSNWFRLANHYLDKLILAILEP